MTVQYQGVWTLQSAAQLQSTQRWVTDPLFENTTLLLQADDAANGAQNNTFLDSSSNSFAITRNGNTTQGSFTPFSSQPGAWSTYFDGSGDSFSVSTSTVLDLNGAIDFTIEAWVYLTGYGSTSDMSLNIANKFTGAGGLGYTYGIFGGGANQGKIQFYGAAGSVSIISTNAIPLNSWNHVAIVKNGTTYTHYLNGVANGSQTTASTLTASANALVIGDYGYSDDFLGYISNLRITKNGALYTSAFTPSLLPFTTTVSVGTVSLLTCQSNRFVDNSSNGFTLTPSGTPSVQAFSPFAPQFQWTPSVIGGSGYFDGTGDWINVADSTAFTLGSGNFTVEFWVYSTTAGVRQFISGQTNSAGANTAASFTIEKTSANKLLGSICSGSSSFAATSSGDIPLNAWTHIALVRDGNTLRQYINGVQDGTADVTGVTANDSSNQLSIGRLGEITTNNYFGYISNYRFVNGTAVYTGAFTPPIAPVTTSGPASSYSSTTNVNTSFAASATSLLSNFTNAGIYDGTMKNNLETVGNAQISTAVVKYGSGSMFFDGTGDWLQARANPMYEIGSGDWTCEMWAYASSYSAVQIFASLEAASGTTYGIFSWAVYCNGGKFGIDTSTGSGSNFGLLSSSNVPVNTWVHLAITRSRGVCRIFINGVLDASSSSFTGTPYVPANPFLFVGGAARGYPYTGYIDDLRITTGIARYTQNFIPPSVALPRQ